MHHLDTSSRKYYGFTYPGIKYYDFEDKILIYT